MPRFMAGFTGLPPGFPAFDCNGHFGGDDTSWYGDNSITDQHNDIGYYLANRCYRNKIAVTHRGDGRDRPIYTLRNAGESIFRILDQVHHRCHNDHDDEGKEKEDTNLTETVAQCLRKEFKIVEEMAQPEYPEDT
jgi:hypothetical protein